MIFKYVIGFNNLGSWVQLCIEASKSEAVCARLNKLPGDNVYSVIATLTELSVNREAEDNLRKIYHG